jgi:hypothetical protein
MSPVSCGFRGRSRAPAGEEDRVLPGQIACHLPWTGSWTGAPDNPSVVSAVSAMIRVFCAGRTLGAWGRASCKRQVSGSNPLTGSRSEGLTPHLSSLRGTNRGTNVP